MWKFGQKYTKFENLLKKGRWLHAIIAHNKLLEKVLHVIGNWLENSYISHMMKYLAGWESNGKKLPYYGKSMRTNFLGFAHLMVFAEFSHAIGNWLENPYISHVMKSIIGWESNGKKAPILWEKYK